MINAVNKLTFIVYKIYFFNEISMTI